MQAAAGPTNAKPIAYSPTAWAILGVVVGVLTIIVSTITHFGILSHGSAGQLVVDMLKSSSLWGVLLGILICFIAIVVYRIMNPNSRMFIGLFILAWISYFLANLSILFSLFQVELSNV